MSFALTTSTDAFRELLVNALVLSPQRNYSAFDVTPPPPSSLSFVPSVRGGTSVAATVYVSYPACPSGIPVTLQSSNRSVARVPATVTISGGQKSASFTITTFSVTTPTSVTISATSDNATKTKVLTVTP